MSKPIGFGYMGGKISHLPWLLPLIPPTDTYVELYGGCMAVMLNKPKSPIEVYNDLNSEVYNLFWVIREHLEELMRRLEYTLYSREEFAIAAKGLEGCDDIERARLFFIKLLQSRLCNPTNKMSPSRWNFSINKNMGRVASRNGMAQGVSRFIGKVDLLPAIAKRIRQIQIENSQALKVIRLYDSPTTLFYADPPYPFESRSKHNIYKYEMSNDDHRKLAWRLNNVKGLVAISGYDCSLNNELYTGWHVHKEKIKKVKYNVYDKTCTRQEVLWTNYDINNLAAPLIKSPWAIGKVYGQQELDI